MVIIQQVNQLILKDFVGAKFYYSVFYRPDALPVAQPTAPKDRAPNSILVGAVV